METNELLEQTALPVSPADVDTSVCGPPEVMADDVATDVVSETDGVTGRLSDAEASPDSGNIEAATAGDTAVANDSIDVERLVAEAEQRGYIRGCNERIENMMSSPGLWQSAGEEAQHENAASDILILNNIRPSIWER